MARTKLQQANYRVMRLQHMLRRAEAERNQLETMEEDIAKINDSHDRFVWLQAKVERANRDQLVKERCGINDIERFIMVLEAKLKFDGENR